jgi:heme b synthase
MTVSPSYGLVIKPDLQLVAWEITRACNLTCAHCRAASDTGPYPGELGTSECFKLVDRILAVGKPILIITGGEPLMRADVNAVAGYAVSKGLRVVMGTNGTLINAEVAEGLKKVPFSRVSFSLDFPIPALQDEFRGRAGAFDAALSGIRHLRGTGIDVQINCTLTRRNINYLDDLLALALREGAVAFHPFFLVPTGRGRGLAGEELSAIEYENALNWIYSKQRELGDRIFFKPTDAPHYLRVFKQHQSKQPYRQPEPAIHSPRHGWADSLSRGCLAGTGFCFISHTGRVQGCGYLDVDAGNIRERDFADIWNHSLVFQKLRDLANIRGKCGACEFLKVCGGCRARAFETTGDYLEAEPYCIYQPSKQSGVK